MRKFILLLLLFSTAILYGVAQVNYLLFHALVEGFAVIVAILVYVLATRTYKHSANKTFLFLGISYLYVAILDFFHLLTYKGMGVFPGFGADTPTQLWLAGRFLEALSLFFVLFLHHKQLRRSVITWAYTLVTAGLLVSIMVIPIFPACFVEGQGLTLFKIRGEYAVILILLGSVYLLFQQRDRHDPDTFKALGFALALTAASEYAFTLYNDVYGIANMLGHLLKIASYYFLFKGVVVQGIDLPYSLIADELKERAIKDELTGLYNRQGMLDLIDHKRQDAVADDKSLGVLMIDLDNFKAINDRHGHLYGDEVLKEFACLLQTSIRRTDTACRFGGDEFVVLAPNVTKITLEDVKKRIQDAADAWIIRTKDLQGLGISIGVSILDTDTPLEATELLNRADASMYAAKQGKKHVVN